MRTAALAAGAYGGALAAAGAVAALAVARSEGEKMSDRLGVPGRSSAARLPAGFAGAKRLRVVGMLGGAGFVGWALAGPVGIAVAVAAGMWGARRIRARRLRERAERAEAQVAELVAAMAAAARAGRSLRGSLEEAATDLEPPLSTVVSDALRDLAVGRPLDGALEDLAKVSSDARLLVTLLGVHARTGGDLPRLLDELGSIVIRRLEARRQASALSAQARTSGAVLASLPIAFVGLLSGVGGGGLGDLYRSPTGAALLAGGLALDWVGFAWLRRIAEGRRER